MCNIGLEVGDMHVLVLEYTLQVREPVLEVADVDLFVVQHCLQLRRPRLRRLSTVTHKAERRCSLLEAEPRATVGRR